jgi:NADH-quinone oxidoreductase subunit N
VGKWAVFTVAMSAGAWPVVVVAIASSIFAVYFYIRHIRLMFFDVPTDGVEVASVTRSSWLTTTTIAVGALGTLVLGLVPGPLLQLAADAGQFIR